MDSPARKLAKKTRCKKARQLYSLCRELNTAAGKLLYNVDHVLDISRGGKDYVENLWIVPAAWNYQVGEKSDEMIVYIQNWIMSNGRFCPVIPEKLRLLEFMHKWRQYDEWIREYFPKISSDESLKAFQSELGASMAEWCRRECYGG
jgi:hypothetical protein